MLSGNIAGGRVRRRRGLTLPDVVQQSCDVNPAGVFVRVESIDPVFQVGDLCFAERAFFLELIDHRVAIPAEPGQKSDIAGEHSRNRGGDKERKPGLHQYRLTSPLDAKAASQAMGICGFQCESEDLVSFDPY